MKCIKCIKVAKGYELDEIRRVSDIDADEKVKGGYWKFIPKSEWKGTLKRAVVKNDTVVSTDATNELSIEEKRLKRKKQK
jgi:hypothetical protein